VPIDPETAVLVALAGFAAGFMNAVVGAGTLVTFPTLVALGYPPVTANASNCLGLVAGSASSSFAYRRALPGGPLVVALAGAVTLGAGAGGCLLLTLPSDVFATAVPFLVVLGCVLMFVPSRHTKASPSLRPGRRPTSLLWGAMLGSGMYGGYFGAAQGVIMLGLLRCAYSTDPQEINAIKNLLGLIANATASVIFVFAAPVAWEAVLLIAVGSIVGGVVGARIGQQLSARALRLTVLVVALSAIVTMLT
jgi:uncharacterized membrane protein YfcA